MVVQVITIAAAALFSFEAHAWMDEWAPVFKWAPAKVEALSAASVSNFVNTIDSIYASKALSCCKGYKLDLNGDGTKDFVYFLPWMVNKDFDLLSYKSLENSDAEKAKMVINSAAKKKEADEWKPKRELTAAESARLIQILTKRFGVPGECITDYFTAVYIWRFEGDEWLSVGVFTEDKIGGKPIGIQYWEWRKPEFSVYGQEEAKMKKFPLVQIDKEGLPPAAFFEFFNPYPSVKDGEKEQNHVTEFNVTKYLEMIFPRCTAEWDAHERMYNIYTKHPDEWRGECNTCTGDPTTGHEDECRVGFLQFYKLAPDLYMCDSRIYQEGTMGLNEVRYLFDVYDRDIWSIDCAKPIKSKVVRYIGAMPMDEVPKFREKWLRKQGCEKSAAPFSEARVAQMGTPYEEEPKNGKCLYEVGGIALFAGETAADVAHNEEVRKSKLGYMRNSLFVRLRKEDGTDVWRLVLTTGSSWKEVDGVNKWSRDMELYVGMDFSVVQASVSMDRRMIWLVCDPHTDMYNVVCRFDLEKNTFKILGDGNTAEEQLDGTILIKGRKTHLQDENGELLGAAWYDTWITPDGKVVKKKQSPRSPATENEDYEAKRVDLAVTSWFRLAYAYSPPPRKEDVVAASTHIIPYANRMCDSWK